MAEPAGLVIGAVGLATVFSTCVELAEYVNLGKAFRTDHDRACTRLDLLKTRLWTWGEKLNIHKPGYEASELRQGWAAEKEIITRSLCSIKDILESAGSLTQSCSPSLVVSSPLPTLQASVDQLGGPETHASLESRSGIRSRASLLWRRTTWALRHKRKLDASLVELEFFIHNLEQVISRLGLSNMSTKEPADTSGTTAEVMRCSYSFGNVKGGKFLQGTPTDVKAPEGNGKSNVVSDYSFVNVTDGDFHQTNHDAGARDSFFKRNGARRCEDDDSTPPCPYGNTSLAKKGADGDTAAKHEPNTRVPRSH